MLKSLFYLCLVFLSFPPFTSQQNQQHSSISDRFYHRQADSLKRAEQRNDVWSSGVRTTSTFFQNVCRCSRIYRNRQLVNVRPTEIAYTQSEEDCVVRCATMNSDMNVACASLNYCNYDRRCELFQSAVDQAGYTGPGKCIPVNGCTYYSINQACLGTFTSSTASTASPTAATLTSSTSTTTTVAFSPFTTSSSTSGSISETTSTSTSTTTTISNGGTGGGSSSKKSCPNGQNAVYSRAQGYADPRINVPDRQIQNIDSSTTCQSQCDNNANCQSFDYNSNSRNCNLYFSVNKDPIQTEPGVDHFDVFCVPSNVNCNGYIERIAKKVQFSSPSTETATSMNDCINKCLSTQPCLATTYYSKTLFNKDNCLLSQQSRQTDPTNFIDEKNDKADYYGLDACSSRGGSAKTKFLKQKGAQTAAKQSFRSSFIQSDKSKTTSAPIPNAKQYRQMLIDAQKRKAIENKNDNARRS